MLTCDLATGPFDAKRARTPNMRWSQAAAALSTGLTLVAVAVASTHGPADGSDQEFFASEIRPILEQHCFACHGPEKQKGGVRFDVLDPDMVAGEGAETWSMARDLLGAGEMPPGSAPQPSDADRRRLTEWLNASLLEASRAKEGERRAVLRRLNKAQYTHTLQDLLGLPIDFGQGLPEDGKSEMGFSNNGEVLRASTLHLESYQAIARAALEQAIVVGERPPVSRYRVSFGRGSGAGLTAGTTGGYQAVPLSTDDFVVDVLDADGRVLEGTEEPLEAIRKRISVGFRGSSQDRFHSVPEGVVLYSALPHKEVAPGAWQGPSPNMKLELQRVFPDEGDFVLRVKASRGYLVRGKKELLISLDEPLARTSVEPWGTWRTASRNDLRRLEPTVLGPWHRAGPIHTASGEEARDTAFLDLAAGLDFASVLADGETTWERIEDRDGEVETYASEIGVVFLARTLDAPTARTLELSLGSDDALWVWLNGEEVLARDVRRGVSPDQDRLSLELREGRNELVLEVVNFGGGFGSYHRLVHDGALAGLAPFDLATEEGARVLRADRSESRENLALEGAGLAAVDFPAPSRAVLPVQCEGGYYQFDLVHPAREPEAMGSIRFEVGELKLDLRPLAGPLDLERGVMVTPIGAGYLNEGRHEIALGGPFFVGFSHLVMTPLEPEHPLVERLESQAALAESRETPALRAYIGTRTDDGMDYMTFDGVREVEAPLGEAEVYSFHGRLENLPIPEPESGDDEILSGILVLGVWNDHLVKSRKEQGPPLLVESLEFEAPHHPTWPPESHRRIFFDSELRADEEAYTAEVLERFLERAFRRPVRAEELQRYVGFWRGVRPDHEHNEHAVREVLVAALSSPNFLFLAEPRDGPALEDEGGPVGEHLLASRLSYFLWNSPPDEELRELARAGGLRDALEAQVTRLLDDPRSERFVRAFTREWLRLDRLEGMTINPNRFPAFTRFVKRDMAEETYRFVDRVLRADLALFELVDSDFAMLNQNLAEFYGVEGVQGPRFRPVALPRDAGRGGLLSQGAFLAGHSDGNEPHPIKRAVWVKEKLLGQPPLPPPPNVPVLDPASPDVERLTLKERIEQHRDNPSCHDCHASFDPFGIALESYSAVGVLERARKGRPIDARVALPDGVEVDGPAGLKRYLLEERPEEFTASVVKHLFAYALGRDVGYQDEAELQAIQDQVRARDHRLRAVIQAVVASPSFSER